MDFTTIESAEVAKQYLLDEYRVGQEMEIDFIMSYFMLEDKEARINFAKSLTLDWDNEYLPSILFWLCHLDTNHIYILNSLFNDETWVISSRDAISSNDTDNKTNLSAIHTLLVCNAVEFTTQADGYFAFKITQFGVWLLRFSSVADSGNGRPAVTTVNNIKSNKIRYSLVNYGKYTNEIVRWAFSPILEGKGVSDKRLWQVIQGEIRKTFSIVKVTEGKDKDIATAVREAVNKRPTHGSVITLLQSIKLVIPEKKMPLRYQQVQSCIDVLKRITTLTRYIDFDLSVFVDCIWYRLDLDDNSDFKEIDDIFDVVKKSMRTTVVTPTVWRKLKAFNIVGMVDEEQPGFNTPLYIGEEDIVSFN